MENNIRKEEKEIKGSSGKTILGSNGNFTTKHGSNPPFINTIIQDESYKANASKGDKDYGKIAEKKEK